MKNYRKIRIQPTYPQSVCDLQGEDLVAYKNRKGHYVWMEKSGVEDKTWPGLKPPKNCIGVECIKNIWYWKYKEAV